MNSIEKEEIKSLPNKYRPLSAWSYFGLTILFSLPIIGFILLIVFSVSDSNINRRSFARSYFCGLFIAIIIVIVIVALGSSSALLETIQNFLSNLN